MSEPNCQETHQRHTYKIIWLPDLWSLWLWSLSFSRIPFLPQVLRPRKNGILHYNINGRVWLVWGEEKDRGLLRGASQNQIRVFSLRLRRLRAWGVPSAGSSLQSSSPLASPRTPHTHPLQSATCLGKLR